MILETVHNLFSLFFLRKLVSFSSNYPDMKILYLEQKTKFKLQIVNFNENQVVMKLSAKIFSNSKISLNYYIMRE